MPRKTRNSPYKPIPPCVADALEEILDYLWDQEREDFEAGDTETRAGHVFPCIVTVRHWLDCVRRYASGENAKLTNDLMAICFPCSNHQPLPQSSCVASPSAEASSIGSPESPTDPVDDANDETSIRCK